MNPKAIKILFWTTTIFIFFFEGVMPLLTFWTPLAKEGIRHLGFPDYFGIELVIFKVLGAVTIIIPKAPYNVKEWAYAGLGLVSISAFIGHAVVDGFTYITILPLIILGIIITSYMCYHTMNKH